MTARAVYPAVRLVEQRGDGGGDGENVSGVDEWEEAVVSCKETSRVPLKLSIEKTKNSCRGTQGPSKRMASGN